MPLPRAIEIECIADPVANDTRIHTSGCIVMSEVRVTYRHLLIVTREATNKDSGIASGHSFQGKSGRFEAFVRNFEHLSLLRIQPHRFYGGDIEESRIEVFRRAVEEVASKYIETSGTFEVLVEM